MTHDDLLAELNQAIKDYGIMVGDNPYYKALRAVVELHKPKDFYGVLVCDGCDTKLSWQVDYPCSTIQAIQKELGA